MSKLTKSDLIPYEKYKMLQDKFLKEIIAVKKVRRVKISDLMTGLFESKLTVLYQIQEMIRIEQITDETYLNELLNVYNDLLPETNELSMTLFIEVHNQEELRRFNKNIIGIEKYVELQFDDQVVTSYEPKDDANEDKEEKYTQSIHYLHFPFTDIQKSAFLNTNNVILKVNHPNYKAETKLSFELIDELKKQLAKQG
ncbi:hypothetical protein BHF71_01920 [Vulcanibacillus modesticaldus]|uniref:DUF3501 domain-containing protein n=1 Tax=Vulcanibacillus modesticaldus TaxID=337097 RepID=A0A1D2YUI0_9BACI|nr:DUF3501 family protein [Vulcanibacillus modesticaldus]OEF99370.1 hypothetical protein BHF71_01920 [Vulcanibacillus modesticaldus]